MPSMPSLPLGLFSRNKKAASAASLFEVRYVIDLAFASSTNSHQLELTSLARRLDSSTFVLFGDKAVAEAVPLKGKLVLSLIEPLTSEKITVDYKCDARIA